MLKNPWRIVLGVSLCLWLGLAQAQSLEQALIDCQQYQQEREQLTCFNALADRVNTTRHAKVAQLSDAPTVVESARAYKAEQTFLERKWHLNKGAVNDNLAWGPLETHRENYLVASMSSNPNDVTETPSQLASANRDLQNKDAHFQISFKTEFVSDFSGALKQTLPRLSWLDSARVWGAYTQRSYWQILDGGDSRPFRETNFAPELILSLGFNSERPSWMPKMINFAGIHESNGRSDPFSRSWNRLYLEGGWEFGDAYTVIVRPWWHIPEGSGSDNSDINRYLGYGDLTLRWDPKGSKHATSLLLRNNLRSDNKGYAKLAYYYGFKPNLNFYAMLSTGYGESLLDYNHAQNLIGFGISVTE